MNNKTYKNWRKQYTESGLWFKGNGESQSFSRLGLKELTGPSIYKKGVFNTDHEWLLKSWANATDDEINDYIKRLQSEGYSKKDLIQIKQQLQDDINGSKNFLVDRFVKKTDASNGIKIVNIDGREYGLLGGGRWLGKNLSMSGINIKTGEMMDIGPKLLNENMSLDEQYEFVKSLENAQIKTAEEIQESIKNFQTGNFTEKTFGDTVNETIGNTKKNVLEETVEAVGETVAGEAVEKIGETIIKKTTGIDVELDGFDKTRAPKKLKKGTQKLKNKTDKYVSKRRQKYEKKQQQRQQQKQKEFIDNTIHIDDEIDLDEINKQWYESKQKEFDQKQKEIDDYFKNNADIDPKDVLKDDYEPDVNKFTDDIDTLKKSFEQSKDFDINKGIDEALDAVNKTVEETTREGGSISKYLKEFSNMKFFDKVQTIGAAAGAVSEYKNARRQGHGVVSSTIRAGVDFALGEAMGMYYPFFLLAKEAPGMIVKGSEMLYKENRKMNSAANQQIFGSAQFQDTQQLATMRQSGMEMAKMAQYNLQQTLMGNEATYFHR